MGFVEFLLYNLVVAPIWLVLYVVSVVFLMQIGVMVVLVLLVLSCVKQISNEPLTAMNSIMKGEERNL